MFVLVDRGCGLGRPGAPAVGNPQPVPLPFVDWVSAGTSRSPHITKVGLIYPAFRSLIVPILVLTRAEQEELIVERQRHFREHSAAVVVAHFL